MKFEYRNSIYLFCLIYLHLTNAIVINDDFNLCKQNMNRPPINLNKICMTYKYTNQFSPEINDWLNSIPKKTYHTKDDGTNFYNIDLTLLSKSQYYVSGDAFECKQTNYQMEYSENFFGAKHSTHQAIIPKLTKAECITMVTTNKCGKHEMKCSMDKCEYKDIPNDEDNYSWLSYSQLTYSHCEYKIHKIHYHTKNEMAFSPKCQAKTGFCELAESVVYWNEDTIHKCPFHYVGNYNFTQSSIDINNKMKNTIHSDHDNVVLGLIGIESHCGINILSTYEGLFVARLEDFDIIKPKLISKGNQGSSSLEQNEIEKINLAQEDYRQLQIIIYVNEINKAECNEFAEILQLYAATANQLYFKLKNIEEKVLYFYSYMGQIFRPDCTEIKEITTLYNQSRCYRDVPVKVLYDNQELNMFLTNNIIGFDMIQCLCVVYLDLFIVKLISKVCV